MHGPAKIAAVEANSHDSWWPSEGVLTCWHSNTVTLVSLRTGRYHQLNESGTRVWRLVVPPPLGGGSFGLNVPQELNEAGTSLSGQPLLRTLESKGLVTRTEPKSSVPICRVSRRAFKDTPISFTRCWLTLLRVALMLRCFGFGPTIRWVSSIGVEGPITTQFEWLARLNRTVARAGTWSPMKAKCLELSLCLVYLARLRGLDVRLQLGVVPLPFEAHAWAELQGQPINESVDNLRLYRRFIDLDKVLGLV